MTRWIVAGTVTLLFALGAGSVEARYEGQIVDAETKEPIAGVVVFMEWTQSGPGGTYYVDAFETVTDEEGRFSLPRYWSWNPWTMLTLNYLTTIFKSGYAPIETGPGAFWAWTRQKGGVPVDPNVWKIDRGRPVILLRKASEDWQQRAHEYMMVSPGVPGEKMQRLQQELNKEGNILSPH